VLGVVTIAKVAPVWRIRIVQRRVADAERQGLNIDAGVTVVARTERPLAEDGGPVVRFAADLRLLRSKAGSPGYRELARLAHYSAAALSDAASGRKLPSLAVTLAYVSACGGDTEAWRRRWHEVAAELTPAAGQDSEHSPYAGLAVFQPEDADRFFGRERLVAALVEQVARERFVVVLGPSGSGKSSLLRAGLLPRMRNPVLVMTPGAHPLEECAARLAALTGGAVGDLHAALRSDSRGLHLAALQAAADDDLLVVVDQFEEVFTLCRSPRERAEFLTVLRIATTTGNSRTRVVLGIRADFYSHCTNHPDLLEALRTAQIVVGPMSTEEMQAAITQPAVQVGHRVETALVSRLVADATGHPGVLPLVSHALLETWRRRRGTTLTLAGYEAAGGIAESIARTAESVYTTLTPEQQRWTRHLFVRLVALGEGTEDTKRRVDRAELDVDTAVLDRLAHARLVVLDRDTVEITHEALVRSWPRLRDWLNDDREGLRVHRRLTEAATTWESAGRDRELLYRGNRLAQTDQWATSSGNGVLSAREREFLRVSLAERAQEQAMARRRARQQRQLLALLTVLLVITATTTILALRAEQSTSEQRNLAIAQNALGQADALRTANPALALQLRLAAYRTTGLPEARNSLLSAFATPYAARLTGHTSLVSTVAFSPSSDLVASGGNDNTVRLWVTGPGHPREVATLTGFPGAISSLVFSPNGRMLATSANGGALRLFDVTDPAQPRELPVSVGGPPIGEVRFSPDGRLLVSGDRHGALRSWDVSDPGRVHELAPSPAATGPVYAVAFNPSGTVLATAENPAYNLSTASQRIRLWDVTDFARPRELAAISRPGLPIKPLLFSPDGRTLIAGQSQNTVDLWDVGDPARPWALTPLTGFSAAVRTVAFSPDGHTMATGGDDRVTQLWDVADVRRPQLLTTIPGPKAQVQAAAFSRDGQTVAVAGADMVVRLEDVSAFAFPARAHSPVYSVAIGPDGHTLVTGNADGTVGFWDTADPYRPRPSGLLATGSAMPVRVAVDRDHKVVAAAAADGAVGMWDVANPVHPVLLASLVHGEGRPTNSAAMSVAFSPDGRILATGDVLHTVRMWNTTDPGHPHPLATLTGFTSGVYAVAFSGHFLATATDTAIQLWDVSDSRHVTSTKTIKPTDGTFLSVAFSPDGRVLAASNANHSVGLWDTRNARPLTTLPSTSTVYTASFSPDGHMLAMANADHTVAVWDITDDQRPVALTTISSPTATTVTTFVPATNVLVAVGADLSATGGLPRLWDMDVDRITARICELAWPRITSAEWDRYSPGLDYQPPCP
jgi:WD40 repeat protein/energy-coupling factor transporter ATP-binding protein EcfA2